MARFGEQALWQEVLFCAVRDALHGSKFSRDGRVNAKEIAVRYVTVPNADFNQVCHLAGVDPVATREAIVKLIAGAKAKGIFKRQRKPRKRSSHHPTYRLGDREHTLGEWSEITGIGRSTIYARLKKGCSVERALTTPVRPKRDAPGVSFDFSTFQGTGGGTNAQDRTNINFSNEGASA